MLEKVVQENKRPEIPQDCPSEKLRKLIAACWDPNPQKRPSFERIIPLFDEIIIESIIKDKHGRALWRKNFNSKGKLQEVVPWKAFVIGLCSLFKQRLPKDPNDIRFKCLKALLVKSSDDTVSIESFGSFLQWFGPMEGMDILDRVVDLLKKNWFHGDISSETAERLLSNEKRGTFLARFSSRDPGCYAISVYSQGGRLKHFRVYHKPGLKYLIGKSECNSLNDIISRYHKELFLKTPCPGSPYEHIFNEKKAKVSAGYLVPEFD